MAPGAWRAAGRAVPGPVGLALWLPVSVVVPLLGADVRHGAGNPPQTRDMLYWALAALPVLGTVVGVRVALAERRRHHDPPVPGALLALLTGTAAGLFYLAVPLATFAWLVPLPGGAGWSCLLGPPLTGTGAVLGYAGAPLFADTPDPERSGPRPAWYLLFGALVALAGGLLAPWLVAIGGQFATTRAAVTGYAAPGSPRLTLPAAGRYGIYDTGAGPDTSWADCRITGGGAGLPSGVTIPLQYGDDESYRWVATVEVPAPGSYTLACPVPGRYSVSDVPRVPGLVGLLVSAPPPLTWLFGALPGLLVVAGAAARARPWHRRSGRPGPHAGRLRHPGRRARRPALR